jgi:Family of unknown function (DUF6496)
MPGRAIGRAHLDRSARRLGTAGPHFLELASEHAMRRTSKSASKDVKGAMHKRKRGKLKSGSGKKVKSRKQAIAVGLSEARRKGKKVAPKKK